MEEKQRRSAHEEAPRLSLWKEALSFAVVQLLGLRFTRRPFLLHKNPYPQPPAPTH